MSWRNTRGGEIQSSQIQFRVWIQNVLTYQAIMQEGLTKLNCHTESGWGGVGREGSAMGKY